MKNLNIKTCLTAIALILLLELVTDNARAEEICPTGQVLGINSHICIEAQGSCGYDCTYTLDKDGNLNISGTGKINDQAFRNNKDVVHAIIGDGITSIGYQSFENASLQSVSLPDTLVSTSTSSFNLNSITELRIPSSFNNPSDWPFLNNSLETVIFEAGDFNYTLGVRSFSGINLNTKVICNECSVEQMNKLETILSSRAYPSYCPADGCPTSEASVENMFIYTKDQENILVKNVDGKLLQKLANNGVLLMTYECKDNGNCLGYDTNKELAEKRNAEGTLIASYYHNQDGSVGIYNTNGILIGIKGKRIFTLNEATALVGGNKNTFSIRYK